MKCLNNKSILLGLFLLVGVCGIVHAEKKVDETELQPPMFGGRKEKKPAYVITEQGPNHRTWSRATWETNAVGRVRAITNSYTELATGLYYTNEQGELEEAKAEIEILPNGAGAIAKKGVHKVVFPPEIKSGLIELQLPDQQWVRSRVWGLAYFDTATGQSVLIAEVRESEGKVVGDNVVIYPNAFTDFVADIRYTYTKSGFEQDVVLREQPPGPSEFGLNPETTRLQMLTEFIESPAPTKTPRGEETETDELLGLGAMHIGDGKAFSVDATGEATSHVFVGKTWAPIEGRDFLIEEVHYKDVAGQLQKLSKAKKYEGSGLMRRGRGENALAGLKALLPSRYAKPAPDTKRRRMARANYDARSSFVMDYLFTLNSSLTNYTFRGDGTYYLSGAISLYGTSTFEGGAVLKYASGVSANVYGPIVCKTESYRPAIFTAKDDDTLGQAITGSSGSPSGYYANNTLSFSYPTAALQLHDLRVLHATTGITVGFGSPYTHLAKNIQFLNIGYAFSGYSGGTWRLQNILVARANTAVVAAYNTTYRAEHLTIDRAGVVNSGATLFLTNSLLTAVTNYGAFTTVNNATNSAGSGVYQTFGAGAFYLDANSVYRNIGTTNIDSALLASLRKKTTYPPVVYSNTIAVNTTLLPQAQRDTDTPDLGYHYNPIDYWAACTVTNATLTLTNGVVLAYYRNAGIHLDNGGRLESYGSPTTRSYLAYFGLVQEQPVLFDPVGLSQVMAINPHHTNHLAHPEVLLNFTTLTAPQGADYAFYEGQDDWEYQRIELRNCEIYGGGAAFNFLYAGPVNASFKFLNNLFEHTLVLADTAAPASATLIARNNLFRSTIGGVEFADWDSAAWQVKDNVFDGIDFYIDGNVGYNAYVNGAYAYSTIQSNDIIVTNFTWVAGPLGNYYQLSTNLINQGSQTAAAAGLYHYTVITNILAGLQVKETNSTVDIGYHYVAVNTNGVPIDTDGDGIPDYVEDADGDGVFEPIPGETVWNCFPPPSGMIAWWAAENNGLDSVGDAHAVMLNGANWGIGKVGLAFNFDGTNDRVVASNSAHLNMGAGADFSMECWIKGYANTTDYGVMTLLSKRYSPNTSTTLGYELYLGNGNLGLRMDDPANKYAFSSSTPDMRDGQFHHVAVTVDRDSSSGGKMYVDGVVVYTFDPTVCPGDLSNSEPWRIGNHPTSSLNCYFKGMIDEPAVYNRALAATEIQAIYVAGTSGKCTEGDGIYDSNFRVQITRPKENSIIP